METLASAGPTSRDEDSMMSAMINTDILLKLPVKSIGRFRCVSKRWRSYLSSPKFVKDHLQFRRTDDPQLLISSWYGDPIVPFVTTFTPESGSENDAVSKKARIQSLWPLEVAGSCNGLVLLRHKTGFRVLVLANPITLESTVVYGSQSVSGSRLGLGYDATNDDYKIVSVDKSAVDIYSVKTRSWRRLDSECPYDFGYGGGGVFLNGRIYWVYSVEITDSSYMGGGMSWGSRGSVVAFDVAREEFEQVPLPDGASDFHYGTFSLGILDGYLSFMSEPARYEGYEGKVSNVWVMKEHGVKDPWIMLTSIECSKNEYHALLPVHFLNADEIVLINVHSKLGAYNRTNGAFRTMVVDGAPTYFSSESSMTFKASLVSPYT